mgnify:CR=1 FL=1
MLYQELSEILDIDGEDAAVQLARRQNRNDKTIFDQLINIRRELFPNAEEFAREIGIREEELERFETSPSEFSVKFLQFYALGLRTEIRHALIQTDRKTYSANAGHDEQQFEDALAGANWLPSTLSAARQGAISLNTDRKGAKPIRLAGK